MVPLDPALWRALSPLLDQALDLDPAARAELLASTSAQSAVLGDALRRLLAEHERLLGSSFLETPAVMPGDPFPTLAGQTIGAYTLERPLGAGGMGTVWLAHRSDGRFDGAVAIKLINLAVLDRAGQDRFRREGTLLARLSHPHIVRLLDAGITPGGQPYLVLEYVDGERIDRYAAAARLDVEARLRLFLQVADAVAHAHAHQVVHRDLKPSNILVDAAGQAKLLDFGVAALISLESGAPPTLTSRAFTPEYAAPEQASGASATTATDVYALGVLLFQLLTGGHPTATPGMTDAAMLRALTEHDAPRPSDTIARLPHGDPASAGIFAERRTTQERLRRVCQGDLDAIIGCALRKDALRRYTQVADLADDLRRHLAGVPVKACGDSVGYRLRKFVARHRLPLGTAATVILTLSVAAAAAWPSYREARTQRMWRETLPRIIAMQQNQQFAAAYRLLRGAQQDLAGDPELEKTRNAVLVPTNIATSPPGAEVYLKGYGEVNEPWLPLGQAPLDDARMPFGYYRWRVQKDGYTTFEGARSLGTNDIFITLSPEGTLPSGMVLVSGGSAQTAGDGVVELPPFYLDVFEVTNRDYQRFVDAGGYSTREYWTEPFVRNGREITWDEAMREMRDSTGYAGPASWRLGTYPDGQDDLPVQGVSWYEAAAFARFAGKRLPSVHHWRRAAGASPFSDILEHSNFGTSGPAAVGHYAGIGEFGTYDMAGNVKEWTVNAAGDKRYILGGAWNEPTYQFTATDAREPFDRAAGNGFRCMMPVPGTTLPAALDRPLPSVGRDYSKEQPVPEDMFRVYRSLYDYDATDLEARVESIDDSAASWRIEHVSYAAAYGNERIPAYLFLPRHVTPPYQVVVSFPAGQFLRSFQQWEMNYLEFILKSGRAVLLPMYQNIYERRLDRPPQGLHAWRDVTIQQVKDLRRSVDYVETRPDLDRSRLAYFGVSLGAQLAPIMLAIEPRFQAAVLWSGGLPAYPRLPEYDQIHFAPRVRTPVLMTNGRDDFTNPLETAQKPLFRWLGTAAEHKRHVLHAGGHVCPFEEITQDSIDWFDRYLGAVPAAFTRATATSLHSVASSASR